MHSDSKIYVAVKDGEHFSAERTQEVIAKLRSMKRDERNSYNFLNKYTANENNYKRRKNMALKKRREKFVTHTHTEEGTVASFDTWCCDIDKGDIPADTVKILIPEEFCEKYGEWGEKLLTDEERAEAKKTGSPQNLRSRSQRIEFYDFICWPSSFSSSKPK